MKEGFRERRSVKRDDVTVHAAENVVAVGHVTARGEVAVEVGVVGTGTLPSLSKCWFYLHVVCILIT